MYSFFLNKILLPLGSLVFSGNYSKSLKQWKQYDGMTKEELERVQKENLSKILSYSVTNVPYYRSLQFPLDTLQDFPILTKTILREKTDALISDKAKKHKLEKNYSSGSSGMQSFTYMTYRHKYYIRALQTHWWMWSGYRPGKPLLQTGLSTKRILPKKLKDIFFKIYYFDSFSLNEKNIKPILNKIENKKMHYFAGHPSALNEIALVAIKENRELEIKSIISYGAKLFDQYILNYNKAFKNPTVINTYGCAEGFLMACKVDNPYYYIMSPHIYLEVVDDEGKPVKDGERGNILVTGLTNFAMPLIRYKLGDLGIMLPKEDYPKKSKFNYPLLQEIVGRETDVIKTPNGNVLIVHSFIGIMEKYPEIRQFKVIQTSKKDLLIEYITDFKTNILPKTETEIYGKLIWLVENSMEISFACVEKIAPSPSGKPQIIEVKDF